MRDKTHPIRLPLVNLIDFRKLLYKIAKSHTNGFAKNFLCAKKAPKQFNMVILNREQILTRLINLRNVFLVNFFVIVSHELIIKKTRVPHPRSLAEEVKLVWYLVFDDYKYFYM